MADPLIAWGFLIFACSSYGLCPDSLRERLWTALIRRF